MHIFARTCHCYQRTIQLKPLFYRHPRGPVPTEFRLRKRQEFLCTLWFQLMPKRKFLCVDLRDSLTEVVREAFGSRGGRSGGGGAPCDGRSSRPPPPRSGSPIPPSSPSSNLAFLSLPENAGIIAHNQPEASKENCASLGTILALRSF